MFIIKIFSKCQERAESNIDAVFVSNNVGFHMIVVLE